jgi:hypothetical protein
MMGKLLGRRRILIVEDDWMIAMDMSDSKTTCCGDLESRLRLA